MRYYPLRQGVEADDDAGDTLTRETNQLRLGQGAPGVVFDYLEPRAGEQGVGQFPIILK